MLGGSSSIVGDILIMDTYVTMLTATLVEERKRLCGHLCHHIGLQQLVWTLSSTTTENVKEHLIYVHHHHTLYLIVDISICLTSTMMYFVSFL